MIKTKTAVIQLIPGIALVATGILLKIVNNLFLFGSEYHLLSAISATAVLLLVIVGTICLARVMLKNYKMFNDHNPHNRGT